MALAVIVVASGGLIGLQTLISRANNWSRQMTTGTDIALTWAERLKADAVTWTDQTAFVNTTWLGDSGVINTWMIPTVALTAVVPFRSYAFDRYGRDIAPNGPTLFYCVGYRFAPTTFDPVGGAVTSLRVDIVTFWPREGAGTVPACVIDGIAGVNLAAFQSVTVPVAVKRTVLPQP